MMREPVGAPTCCNDKDRRNVKQLYQYFDLWENEITKLY